MDQTLQRLIELQEIDADLLKLEAEVMEPPGYFSVRERRFRESQKSLEVAEGGIKERELEIKRNELEVNSRDEQKDKLEVQLNSVKTNREYSAIREQIAAAEADKSRVEDTLLELMEELEGFKAEIQAVRDEAQEAQREFDEGKKMVAEDSAQMKKKIEELRTLRDQKASEVQPEALHTYQRILDKRGVAMAAVIDQACQGCFMTITTHSLTLVTKGDTLVQCQFCNRLLYLPQESTR